MNKTPFDCKSICRLATICFSIFVLFGSVSAGTFIVTKTADTNDGVCNADCSLREAVAAANSAGGAVIEFDAAVFSTPQQINLVGDSLNLNSGIITIRGRDINGVPTVTISGSNSYRVFFINQSVTAEFFLLKITNGRGWGQNFLRSGGAIYNSAGADTWLRYVTVSDSSVASPDGGIALFGGGIYNAGAMRIDSSRIENNSVPASPTTVSSGGGIYNAPQGSLDLRDSSVTNNTVSGNGGGISNASQASATLRNVTISGNSATGTNGNGGGLINFGSFSATQITVANNTATANDGVSTADTNATYNSKSSIYADNTVGANDRDFRGPMVSEGFNLIENTTDTVITGDTTGNILNQDPMLSPLSIDESLSFYHKPSWMSPVIDKGTSSLSNDQRGKRRRYDDPATPNAPNGDSKDIGAIELQLADFPSAPFDFDGDRKTDIAIFRPSNGSWWLNLSSNNMIYNFNLGLGNSGDKIVPGDYTSDGKADIALFRPSEAKWYRMRSEFGNVETYIFGATGDIPVPGDFDGDGIIDQGLYRPSTGAWIISTNSGVTTQYFGIAEDKPAVADYDGDGKADIAIFRPSAGAWWINRSSQGIIAIQFGDTNDKIVQGDYTGDGKADLALWRESNGFWYILRSEDYSFYGFPFGTAGDVPVPGDYDGDSRIDAGIFRPSNNGWYLLRSTQGYSGITFGISGDVPVPSAFVR